MSKLCGNSSVDRPQEHTTALVRTKSFERVETSFAPLSLARIGDYDNTTSGKVGTIEETVMLRNLTTDQSHY
jgi:hypothetical protein